METCKSVICLSAAGPIMACGLVEGHPGDHKGWNPQDRYDSLQFKVEWPVIQHAELESGYWEREAIEARMRGTVKHRND